MFPSNWEVVEQADGRQVTIKPKNSDNNPIIVNAEGYSFTADMSAKPSPDEIINNQINRQVGKDYPRNKKVINGKAWFFYENTISSYKSINYFTSNKSILYEVDGSTLKEEYINVVNKILSTFKFTQ